MAISILGAGAKWLVTLLVKLTLLPWTLLKAALGAHTGSTAESYSSFDHLALNVKRPETEWLNMGDWSNDAPDLPTASEQLARRLYREAKLQTGAAILDVGHGCGDSLLLLMREYQPSQLHGVTSLPAHASRARRRLKEAGYATTRLASESTNAVAIHCEDAVAFVERLAATGDRDHRYDFIFALDCAYHFKTRQRFLDACMPLLKPGGVLALADLIVSHPYPRGGEDMTNFEASTELPAPQKGRSSIVSYLKHRFVLVGTGVPAINMIPAQGCLGQLEKAGFSNDLVQIKDIAHVMFPGFARYLKSLGQGEEAAWRGGGTIQLAALRLFGSVVEGWAQGGEKGMVRSVIVTAEKAA